MHISISSNRITLENSGLYRSEPIGSARSYPPTLANPQPVPHRNQRSAVSLSPRGASPRHDAARTMSVLGEPNQFQTAEMTVAISLRRALRSTLNRWSASCEYTHLLLFVR